MLGHLQHNYYPKLNLLYDFTYSASSAFLSTLLSAQDSSIKSFNILSCHFKGKFLREFFFHEHSMYFVYFLLSHRKTTNHRKENHNYFSLYSFLFEISESFEP